MLKHTTKAKKTEIKIRHENTSSKWPILNAEVVFYNFVFRINFISETYTLIISKLFFFVLSLLSNLGIKKDKKTKIYSGHPTLVRFCEVSCNVC